MTRSTDALALLRSQAHPFVTTEEAAMVLGRPRSTTAALLTRLADAGLIKRVRRGHWAIDPSATPLAYGAWVTAPLPAYVSLYTALYHHGLIEQIPVVIYVVSLGKTREVETTFGTYSVHQIQPKLMTGFAETNGVRMATPEKAVFDTLYLRRARSGKFAALTEVELPEHFDRMALYEWAAKIEAARVRSRVLATIDRFLERS